MTVWAATPALGAGRGRGPGAHPGRDPDRDGQPGQQLRINADGTETAVDAGRCPDVDGAATADGTRPRLPDGDSRTRTRRPAGGAAPDPCPDGVRHVGPFTGAGKQDTPTLITSIARSESHVQT
ncbi:hypothetical protein TPA0907_31390 [Micromonospora humidisoli]|nr:hypothetical protein TPA0907_31390 [Micromonospora sp. AKA109]